MFNKKSQPAPHYHLLSKVLETVTYAIRCVPMRSDAVPHTVAVSCRVVGHIKWRNRCIVTIYAIRCKYMQNSIFCGIYLAWFRCKQTIPEIASVTHRLPKGKDVPIFVRNFAETRQITAKPPATPTLRTNPANSSGRVKRAWHRQPISTHRITSIYIIRKNEVRLA